jgi:radical SAM-linked protein
MKRYRLHYYKTKEARYTSNLDLHKMWERWLRRAVLPVSYSQGFHPQPKINQAAPLPLGMLSQCELVDIWLDEDLPPQEVLLRMMQTPQPGLPIQSVTEVDLPAPTLQSALQSSTYLIRFYDDQSAEELKQKVAAFLANDTIMRERRGKAYDLRPLILSLDVVQTTEGKPALSATLAIQTGATGRADELVEAMNISQEDVLIERISLNFG